MQFQVPQFIETEDKVVGPFSLRQFLYVGGACAVSAMAYFVLQTWLSLIIALILIGGSLAISFIKVEGRPLLKVLISAGNYYWRPQAYVWKAEHAQVVHHAPTEETESGLPLEDIVSGMALKKLLATSPLHKSWESVQTGGALKTSDKQFIDQKMEERYQIFRKTGGDQNAARRVDYR